MKKIFIIILVLALALACRAETYPDGLTDRLNELGYYVGDVVEAISNFQKANSLSVTGTLDPTTQELIFSDKAVSQEAYLNAFLAENTDNNKTYDRGSEGSTVRSIRAQLELLGYGVTSGSEYDTATFYAVAAFQALNSMEVTGRADPETQARLFSQHAVPCSDADKVYELSAGDSGYEVKQLQNELSELGYFTGSCTGIFGSATLEAVKAFQKANALDETGTWSLYQQLLVNYGKCVSRYETDEYEASLSLSLGSQHECVLKLETKLRQLGYFTGTPDELYDAATELSVRVFQEANGLIANGIADPETRRMAEEDECVTYDAYYQTALTQPILPGDENYAVLLCSRRLAELGFPMSEKWLYDDEMEQMLVIFRQATGFADTQGADSEVRAYMNSGSAPVYNKAKLLSDNYAAQKAYLDRVRNVTDAALAAVGLPYEAGKSGPESYGMAGLVSACYESAGIATEPTVSLQLEKAVARADFSDSLIDISEGRQIFLKHDETLLTGICVGSGQFAAATPESGCVALYDISAELDTYEFIGTVMWN